MFIGTRAFSNIILPISFGVPHKCEMVEHRCVYVVFMYITRYVYVIVMYIPTITICTPHCGEIVKHRYVYIDVMYIQHYFISLLWICQHWFYGKFADLFMTTLWAGQNWRYVYDSVMYITLLYYITYVVIFCDPCYIHNSVITIAAKGMSTKCYAYNTVTKTTLAPQSFYILFLVIMYFYAKGMS